MPLVYRDFKFIIFYFPKIAIAPPCVPTERALNNIIVLPTLRSYGTACLLPIFYFSISLFSISLFHPAHCARPTANFPIHFPK
jgi:hypothetical protein